MSLPRKDFCNRSVGLGDCISMCMFFVHVPILKDREFDRSGRLGCLCCQEFCLDATRASYFLRGLVPYSPSGSGVGSGALGADTAVGARGCGLARASG